MKEPLIHSHITDCLPEDHPLAYEQVRCGDCHTKGRYTLVHAANNECMQTWVETGKGPLCLSCFAAIGTVLDNRFALP